MNTGNESAPTAYNPYETAAFKAARDKMLKAIQPQLSKPVEQYDGRYLQERFPEYAQYLNEVDQLYRLSK